MQRGIYSINFSDINLASQLLIWQPTNTNPAEPPVELSFYEALKQKSHYDSLRDQLRFIVKPELRQQHESYVFQRANATGYKALAPSNWQEVPDLTVANLYHYFKQQERYA